MAWHEVDSRFPWIWALPAQGGEVMVDRRTGDRAFVRTQAEALDFVARHSAAPGARGLGDLVRGVAGALGFQSCSPCKARQAALNRLAPRVMRR